MYPYFDVEGVDAEKLLHDWRWLLSGEPNLIAINAFGDLFLEDASGAVHRLDVSGGTVSAIAASVAEFREAAKDAANRRNWLLEERAEQAAQKGCHPGKGQCVGYKVPLVFKQGKHVPDNMYVADLYEYVSFLGDLHCQVKEIPDGGKVRIKFV